ncbi:MAG: RHS repeat-associated core domain-containing protein [Myxococcales bacterium]
MLPAVLTELGGKLIAKGLVLAGALGCAAPAAAEDRAAELRWDYRGRLVSASAGRRVASYFYAAGMDRVIEEHDGSVTFHVSPNFEVRDGVSVSYARVGERRVGRTGSTALQAMLVADLRANAAPTGRIDVGDAWLARPPVGGVLRYLFASARRLLLEHGASAVFLHQDQLRNATLASGPAAQVLGECASFAYGETRSCRGHVDTYGFTGQRSDPSTGFVHFQFRELEPGAGRWASPDPLFLEDSNFCLLRPFECADGYGYVLNNPLDAVDPSGEKTTTLYFGVDANGSPTFMLAIPDHDVPGDWYRLFDELGHCRTVRLSDPRHSHLLNLDRIALPMTEAEDRAAYERMAPHYATDLELGASVALAASRWVRIVAQVPLRAIGSVERLRELALRARRRADEEPGPRQRTTTL